jgi:hypothetical protein
VKITLPLPPNMANSRTHWRVKNKQRKAYFEACEVMRVLEGRIGDCLRPHRLAKAKLRATVYCGGMMDHDNCLSRLKWPVDWMVTAGYLAGDKPSQLEWHWPIEQVVSRKQTYRVEFELEAA